jgi:hypothetical protein
MLRIKRTTGTPISVGKLTVTPEMRSVMWQSARGGVVWSTPSAVLVEQGGRSQRIRIFDVTRLVQLLLFGTVVAVPLVRLWLGRRERNDTDDQ